MREFRGQHESSGVNMREFRGQHEKGQRSTREVNVITVVLANRIEKSGALCNIFR